MRDYCGACGETYDTDNLEDCSICGRSFCYRCGDFGERTCRRCADEGKMRSDTDTRGHCDHCLHRRTSGPLVRITSPVRTSFLHVCCLCGEQAYLAYELDDAGTPRLEPPARGHLHRLPETGAGCAECTRCAE